MAVSNTILLELLGKQVSFCWLGDIDLGVAGQYLLCGSGYGVDHFGCCRADFLRLHPLRYQPHRNRW